MKNKIIYLSIIVMAIISSCKKSFLTETPQDFLSPENSYTTLPGFTTAVQGLYPFLRNENFYQDSFTNYNMYYGTDMVTYGTTAPTGAILVYYDQLNANNGISSHYWTWAYQIIQQTNVIITRANNPAIVWTPAQKNAIVAEARFVRGYTYNVLVNLFNGVPISATEITTPKLDFSRVSRDSVLSFIQADLQFASQNLPDAPAAPGRVGKAAAYHLLAEVDINRGDYNGAIAAASAVINNPNYHLMTTRFGIAAAKPGDVFSDLFKDGSYNSSANKEAIWVLQYEYGTAGTSGSGGTSGNDNLRGWGPQYWNAKVSGLILPPNGADSLGRGVGWVVPTHHLAYDIWAGASEATDMRNSQYNIRRTWYFNDPTKPNYGKKYVRTTDSSFFFFPTFRKIEGILYDATTGRTFTDIYNMRLAETYLLRAEAYLDKGDLVSAAADINAVRARANATPVLPANVNIDYILDERQRELAIEEPRRRTLTRLNLLYNRVKLYGSVESANSIQTKNNWLPIPQSAIDANKGAVLDQNPGY
ncbi:MAG: RagB/SusD family nutrient uptake outer membrane protein [Mucilaginibacter sp.]